MQPATPAVSESNATMDRSAAGDDVAADGIDAGAYETDRLRDLEIENERLRRLVVDLLLEKSSVESALREKQTRLVRRVR